VQSVPYRHLLPWQPRSAGIYLGKIDGVSPARMANDVHYQKYEGFEFMEDLVNEMTHPNPVRRPLIEDVMAKLARIRESLSGFKLRSTITSRRDPVIVAAYRRSRQAFHTIQYIISNKPAIPEPC
jgi:hypothetical protein